MSSLAFYAFLLVGETSVVSSNKSNVPLQFDQLTKLVASNKWVVALKLSFRTYKHSYNSPTFSLTISRQVNVWLPLFVSTGGQAVSREMFIIFLSKGLVNCNLESSRYKQHSFRIGATSQAAGQGFTDAQIKVMGRWKSTAFFKNIHLPAPPRQYLATYRLHIHFTVALIQHVQQGYMINSCFQGQQIPILICSVLVLVYVLQQTYVLSNY